ncbi:MAG: SPOR domain-containing protein [Acetobacteraceae bacterium]
MSDEMSIRTPAYRIPRSRGMDPATKRLALIAVVLGAALLTVVGAWSVIGHRPGGVPVIAPQAGPIRVKPTNPGGMQLANTNADLFGGDHSSGTGDGKLAPPPEVPDPQALRTPPPAPARTPSAPPAAAKAPIAGTAVPLVQATANPRASSSPAPAAAAKPAAKAANAHAPAAAGGPILVQLAALPTEQAAKDEWALLQHRMPDLLHGRRPAISRADVDGHTWWRLRTGGFGATADASGFCGKVKAKGGACDVIRS